MKEIFIHEKDMPNSCVACDFRNDTICMAKRIDDGEYMCCKQSKNYMNSGKPKACPLRLIEQRDEEIRKERTKEVYGWLKNFMADDVERFCRAFAETYYIEAKE